eukprot:4142664-Pyramimonas_sp.AAC.1
MVRIFALRGLGDLRPPGGLTFGARIDGVGLNAVGPPRHIVVGVAEAARGCDGQSGLVSSSLDIPVQIQKHMGELGGAHSESIVILG